MDKQYLIEALEYMEDLKHRLYIEKNLRENEIDLVNKAIFCMKMSDKEFQEKLDKVIPNTDIFVEGGHKKYLADLAAREDVHRNNYHGTTIKMEDV